VFVAVVETGSFAAAGRKLNRAVSVISYGVANLEAQLGVRLFDREGTRRPVLTEAGRAVLADARGIAQGMDELRAKVSGLLHGVEAELHLAVDVMLPSARLGRVLRAFAEAYQAVSLHLHVEALGAVAAMVLDGRASVGISGPLVSGVEELDRISAGVISLIPVAARSHPLAQTARVPPGQARHHVQLVLSDRSPLTAGRDFSVVSPRTWRLADLGAKHALLREGIGWGHMPLCMVQEDLDAGRLVRLALCDLPGGNYRLSGIWRRDTPPRPAAAWLLEQFERLGRDDATPSDLADLP
jgi:DNA-binding transcriptional LysR family regulator